MQTLRRALAGDHPIEFLLAVSGLVAATEPRANPFSAEPQKVGLAELLDSFEGTDIAQTTAALHVMAALTPDELLAARIRRVIAARRQPVPGWLRDLRSVEVIDVREMRHVLRDGEDYFLEVRLPGGQPMTAMVYVDNNLGGVVKDAFVIAATIEMVQESVRHDVDSDTTWAPVDRAQARAIVEQAIKFGSIVFPPLETDTWPLCGPLVRWLLSLLPDGGAVPEQQEWSQDDLARLTREFLASPVGSAYDDEEHRSLLDDVLWFGTSQGLGDPLRWSSVNVEILLSDWYPRKVVGEPALLAKLPPLLRAFIEYCHQRQGLRRELTAETLEAVDRWEPDYQQLIGSNPAQGAEALARMLLDYEDDEWDSELEAAVGGADRLADLSAAPLPDEALEWAEIPEDIRQKVTEIVGLCDENAMTFLDEEHRTANRRLLKRVAVADPAFFRGRATARTSAAAICWMVAHANDSTSMYGPLTSGELLEPFGATSPSQRAKRFRKALGLGEHTPYGPMGGPMSLGSPDFLVGERRQEILDERDGLR